ncbi:MAG TPA: hypothetical protein VMN81_01205 [Vicinamibacterales bacterium]|nr:hypothetical protein [Vicinamibacterales bacterium]
MTRLVTAAILAVALWLSAAVFAPTSSEAGSAWLAALPSWPALAAAFVAAALLNFWRPPVSPVALLPLVAVLLPWLPGLDAGLIFAGPLVILVWAAVLVIGWGPAFSRAIAGCACATSANRATIAAFLIALASTSLLAWRVAPMIPGGDEPHYLIITQSLMQDGDLRIENNHAQRDYAQYAAGELEPQYLVRGQNGAIYPIHAPGLPALVIPAFALGGYAGVVVFLLIVMALASALVWRLAWLATGDIAAAWFGWAAVAASCTWAFQSFLVFPDALGGAAVACGLWLVLRLDRRAAPAPPAIAAVGFALAMLPWLHTRFAVLAAGLGLMIVLRLWAFGARPVATFLAAPVLAAGAWFGFFQAIYGTPSPLAPWGGAGDSQAGWIPGGLAGLLFDQQFGLLPYAPVLAAGCIGLAFGAAGWRRSTRLQLALLVVAAYLAASASYTMWWAGLSVPARLMTVLLPVLAPGAAAVWLRARTPVLRAALGASLAWTMFATLTLAFAERGQVAWNVRQYKAGFWFEWVAPLLNWTEALPAFFRAGDHLGRESLPLPAFYVTVGIWLAVMAAALAAAFVIARLISARAGHSARAAAAAVTVTALALALPVATALSLRAQGADGAAPSRAQVALLSRMAEGGAVVLDLHARRPVRAELAASSLRVAFPAVGGDGASYSLESLPAGLFRVTGDPAGAQGRVIVGRARAPIAVLGDGPLDIALPVAVNALTVQGAEGRAITLQPLAAPTRRTQQKALRAMRYGAVAVYFLDDRAYAEPDAFWVGGARYANVVLQADPGVRHAELEIVNAPVANRVSVVGAAQPFERDVMPGEAMIVPLVFDERGAARLQIDSAVGFIPAEAEPGNQDRRFLGVYVKVR